MDFLNKMGSTITNKSKDAAKKAKEIAEVSNLNNQICTQENTINKLCLEIGQIVYQHRDSFQSPLLNEKYGAVSNAYAEIARLKKEIITVKGAKQCPCCGNEVALNYAFCPNCGTAVPFSEPIKYPQAPLNSNINYPDSNSTDCQSKCQSPNGNGFSYNDSSDPHNAPSDNNIK